MLISTSDYYGILCDASCLIFPVSLIKKYVYVARNFGFLWEEDCCMYDRVLKLERGFYHKTAEFGEGRIELMALILFLPCVSTSLDFICTTRVINSL